MRGIVKSQFNLEVNTVFAHLKSPATDASLLSPSSGAAAADPASISDHDLRKLTWGVCHEQPQTACYFHKHVLVAHMMTCM